MLADDVDLLKLAEKSCGFSGSDLRELCRYAATFRLSEKFRKLIPQKSDDKTDDASDLSSIVEESEELRPINMADLL